MPNLRLEPANKLLKVAYFFFALISSIPVATFISWALVAVSGVSDFEGASGYAVMGLFPFTYLALVLVLILKFASLKAAESKLKYAVDGFGLISFAFVIYLVWIFSRYL